eukprot:100937-Amphidinium_carterae.1
MRSHHTIRNSMCILLQVPVTASCIHTASAFRTALPQELVEAMMPKIEYWALMKAVQDVREFPPMAKGEVRTACATHSLQYRNTNYSPNMNDYICQLLVSEKLLLVRLELVVALRWFLLCCAEVLPDGEVLPAPGSPQLPSELTEDDALALSIRATSQLGQARVTVPTIRII